MEPKCDFCDTYDKHRCKTLAQATGCHAYSDAHTRIPDADFIDPADLTPSYMLKVGGKYKLGRIPLNGGGFKDIEGGGEWTIIRFDEAQAFGVKDGWDADHKGTPLRMDGLWLTIHDPAAPRPGFDEWALSLAVAVASRSRDPSTKVGAVIIRQDKTICSMGYNGFPRQMEDKAEWWNDREEKYYRVIHAEMNALLNSKEPVTGMTLYVTHPPCEHCAKHVAAAGIARIVCGASDEIRTRFNIDRSLGLLADCGVEVKEIEYGGNNNNASTGGEGAETSSCETC